MNTEQKKLLTALLLQYTSLSSASLDKIISSCEIKTLAKGECFAAVDKTDAYEYFLLSSLACRFVLDEQGEVVITGFYLPGSVITPHFARTVKGRSIYNLQVLTDGALARMPVKILDALRYSFDDIRTFGLKVVEKELTKILQDEVAHRALTASDRLLTLREQYPNLENLIPHTLIASYLGITPVSFSRLRNELARR